MVEVRDRYTCYACDSGENARTVIAFCYGYSVYMFSHWRFFRNFHTKAGIQVKCANGQLIKDSGVCLLLAF